MHFIIFLLLFRIFLKCDVTEARYLKNNSELYSNGTCQTPGCINAASRILDYMDPTIKPCEDFYKFACGNFLNSTVIPDYETTISTFQITRDKLQEQLRMLIEEESRPDEPEPFSIAKNLYKICMNETAIEENGLKTIRNVLKKLGGWPVLEGDAWQEATFDWKQTVYTSKKLGYPFNHFFTFMIGRDLKNSTKQVIKIDEASFGLPVRNLAKGWDDSMTEAYYDYMVDIAVIFGANKTTAEEELEESLQFEIELAEISNLLKRGRNFTAFHNPMTLKDLQGNYTTIPWKEYFNTILKPHVKVDEDEIIIVKNPIYFEKFEELMQRAPKRIQANYAIWRVIAKSVTFLTRKMRERQLDLITLKSGKVEREARWKECIDLVSNSLSLSVGALYVRKYFNEESKKNVVEMANDIRQQFKEILQKVDWMDIETRTNALTKAEAMSIQIAYPDELLDDKKLEKLYEELYEELKITPGDYLQTISNLKFSGTNHVFRQLRKPMNKSEWLPNVRFKLDIDASYSPLDNSIHVPAGILQGDFFSNDRPRYMNYGAIGWIIGHEITHAFDDKGRQFDGDGNLVEWWKPETKEKFIKKIECIIKQYGNYTVGGVKLKLDGRRTQGENIADNGGIKESYLAYQEWVKRNGQEPRLPGLDYTPSQLFWMSAAQMWCTQYRLETLKLRIKTNHHSPGEFRVMGSFSNSPEFAKDFNCPLGSKMNPQKKCSVW